MFCLLKLYFLVSAALAQSATQMILESLLKDYDRDTRPSSLTGGPLEVTVIPNQFLLLSMDQQQETIEYMCEFMMSWVDPQLAWATNDTHRSIPEAQIWTPDMTFNNELKSRDLIEKSTRMADLRYDGTVRQSSPAVVVTACHLDIDSFPYDDQASKCNITMGSWIFTSSEIVVRSYYDVVPLSDKFEGNNEWQLITMTASTDDAGDNDGKSYAEVSYTLQLNRKPVYYILVIQAPTFIVGTMTLFGIFTPFSMEGERKEKVTLGLTMLLSISMVLNLVSDMMPVTSRMPLLGTYILIEIFMCAIAVLVSIGLLYAHHRLHTRGVKPPKWLLTGLRITSCGCLCKSRKVRDVQPDKKQASLGHPIPLETDAASGMQDLLQLRVTIAKTIATFSRKMSRMEEEDDSQSAWMRVFDTLDGLLLIAFQAVNVTMAVVYMRAPSLIGSMINQTASAAPLPSHLANATDQILSLLKS